MILPNQLSVELKNIFWNLFLINKLNFVEGDDTHFYIDNEYTFIYNWKKNVILKLDTAICWGFFSQLSLGKVHVERQHVERAQKLHRQLVTAQFENLIVHYPPVTKISTCTKAVINISVNIFRFSTTDCKL